MIKNVSNQAVIDTNDEGLRKYTYGQPKVFAIFTSDNCPVCTVLEVAFSRVAVDDIAHGIFFVRLNSDENPVAKRLMNEQSAPFFVSYCQGRMVECGTCETEPEMLKHLVHLRDFVPRMS